MNIRFVFMGKQIEEKKTILGYKIKTNKVCIATQVSEPSSCYI
jgi:hypothetical protein